MTTQRRIARRPVARGGAPRRLTAWDDAEVSETLTSGATGTHELMQNVSDPEKRGCTLVRCIINLWLVPNVPGQVEGLQQLWIGISLVSDDAFVAGALPDVDDVADYPMGGWLLRRTVVTQDMVANASNRVVTAVDLDLRAQRKMDRSTMVMSFLNQNRGGTPFTVRLVGLVRCLYKLP